LDDFEAIDMIAIRIKADARLELHASRRRKHNVIARQPTID
jgi:hypothetical protein